MNQFWTCVGPVLDLNGPYWNLKLTYFGPYLDLEKSFLKGSETILQLIKHQTIFAALDLIDVIWI